ncbi:MAG: DUF2680 domain-containing protein [Firmicutes bacterium]|nr:DUF2680 domain-containing protein [Bacillota bacterium]
MKKVLVMALTVVLALGVVVPAFASENGDALVKAYTQRLEAQKEYIDALVEAGQLTQAQADLIKKNIDIRIEWINSDEFDPTYTAPGFWGWGRRGGRFAGPMRGFGPMMGGFGPGFCGGACFGYGAFPAPVR